MSCSHQVPRCRCIRLPYLSWQILHHTPPRNKAGLMKKPFISEGGGKGLFTQPSYLPPHLPPPAANGCCSVPSVLRFLRLLVTSPKDPEGGGSFFIPNFQTASKRHIWKKKTLREKFRENEKTYLN